jgi:integrase/recombinase XerD
MNAIEPSNLILIEPQPLDQNPAAVYIAALGGIKSTGGRTQAQALRVIAQTLGTDPERLAWGNLRYQHTAAIRARLAASYSPASANKILSALRQTLKHARRLGQISGEDYDNAIDLDPVTGETLPAGRELSTGEILALITTCSNDVFPKGYRNAGQPNPAGTRDAAIIGVMYAAGLRRDEVIKLDVDDYEPETGKLLVKGKRNKQRTAYILNGAGQAVNDWLAIRSTQPGPLFISIRKNGNMQKGGEMEYSRMTSQAIYNMLAKRAAQAGIKGFSPHDMRRTFISHLLEAGADIATVSKMAGHSNVQTTARYDRRPEEAKRKAASLLHVPYTSKGK